MTINSVDPLARKGTFLQLATEVHELLRLQNEFLRISALDRPTTVQLMEYEGRQARIRELIRRMSDTAARAMRSRIA